MNGITKSDASVLHKILAQGTYLKVAPLFRMVREQVAPQLEQWGYKFDRIDTWADSAGHAVWDWCYFRYKKTQWYVAWGLTGEGKQFFEDSDVPDSLLAFVYLASDPGGLEVPLDRLPSRYQTALTKSGWVISRDRHDCRRTQDASRFFDGSGGFTQGFIHWLKEPLEQANEILEKSYANIKSMER